MMAVARDPVADALEEAQRRLTAWGLACGRESKKLGLPRLSSMHQIIDHARREDAKRKGVRKRRIRKGRAKGEPVYIRTADGTQDKSFRASSLQVESKIMEIDGIVARMPGHMQAVIIRSYLYGRSDRKAAQDLCIRRVLYRERRDAAEEYVAERLAFAVKSDR